jgi:hypothetical protein
VFLAGLRDEAAQMVLAARLATADAGGVSREIR